MSTQASPSGTALSVKQPACADVFRPRRANFRLPTAAGLPLRLVLPIERYARTSAFEGRVSSTGAIPDLTTSEATLP
jgi:hypothetical protein